MPFSESPALVGTNGPITACLTHEDEKVYHGRAGEYLSSHQLRDFRKCPAHFIRKRNGLVADGDRPAFLVGRALHCLVIEGRAEYERRYVTGGLINEKTGKPYGPTTKAHLDWARQQTREVLVEEQSCQVEAMADAVTAHDIASRLFAGGVGEGVVRQVFSGVPCQIRIDYLHPLHGLIDLKTCEDLDWFESDSRKYGYMQQLAFYRGVLAQAAGMKANDIPCHLVAVEKVEPHRCGVWHVVPALLDDFAIENQRAIEEFAACEATGIWPTRYEEVRTFYA